MCVGNVDDAVVNALLEFVFEVFANLALCAAADRRVLTWIALAFVLTGVPLGIAGLSGASTALLVVGTACVVIGVSLAALDHFFIQRDV